MQISTLATLEATLPITHFLVAFAKMQVGRFKARHQREIIHALIELTDSPAVNSADIQWWITEGMPKAGQIYTDIGELAQRMDATQRRIARRAAINIVGPSESENRLRCRELIDRLFPTVNGPSGIELL